MMTPFWEKALACKHHNLYPNYLHLFSCDTPYCHGREVHCKDCKAFITSCGCGYNNGVSGWSLKKEVKRNDAKNIINP
jgi:hypothetical protein